MISATHRLIGVLGEQDKGQGTRRVQKLGEQFGSCRIPRLMFKEDKPIITARQHCLSFFQRARMIEFGRQGTPVPVENFPNEKEILYLASYQQDAQKRGCELGRD